MNKDRVRTSPRERQDAGADASSEDKPSRAASCLQAYLDHWNPYVIVLVGFLASLAAAVKITCFPVMINALQMTYGDIYDKYKISWIGQGYACLSLLLIPLMAGIIDISGFGYRVFMLISGFLHLIGCLSSSGVYIPGFLILTDSLINGVASALLLATVILIMDEYFPPDHRFRVIATTMAQGQIIGMFFFADAFSIVINKWGWRTTYSLLGLVIFALCAIGFVVFRRRTDGDRDVIIDARSTGVALPMGPQSKWNDRVLGITVTDIEATHTLVFWLIERTLVDWIQRGTFLYLLSQSGVTRSPFLGAHITATPQLWMAFMFSAGSTLSYVVVCVVGNFYRRNFLVAYIVGAFGTFCSFVLWKVVQTNVYASVVFGAVAGVFVGMSNTFAYAASEEVTGLPGRRVFPYTKMPQGISVCLASVVASHLNNVGGTAHESVLPFYAVVAALDLCVLIVIWHRRKTNLPAYPDMDQASRNGVTLLHGYNEIK